MNAHSGFKSWLGPSNSAADLTASGFLRELRAGRIGIEEYASACADRIDALDGTLRAFACFDRAHFEARMHNLVERVRVSGRSGHLVGVPVGVKDIFNTYDMPTSMGSDILRGYTPGNDARVVSNIRLENGLIAGKTVTAEFAVHHPGPTVNPWDPARTPGTSSSGSAVAVATRMIPVALASQTAGSIIRPASYCGVVGYKPSFGLVPRTGVLKTTDVFDTIGFMTRSVEDARLMFEVSRVRGHNYPVTERQLNDPARVLSGKRPIRIGVLVGPKSGAIQPAVTRALDKCLAVLEGAAFICEPIVLPSEFDEAHDLHEQIYRRSLAYYFKSEWSSASEKFSPILREMIESGNAIDPAGYPGDVERLTTLSHQFDAALSSFDAVICPSTSDEAPIGLDAPDLPDHCLLFTMFGAPAIGLPLLTGTSGLPVGLQIAARRFDDYRLLDIADRIEALFK